MATATVRRLAKATVDTSASFPGGAGARSGVTRWRRAQKLVRSLWRGLREWCGDSAYEHYLRATQKSNSPFCPPPLSREQFYVEQLNRRYSRPNRCC
jgi:uncharacterized short protein YbdD (DUF466 family)